jgi:drug/metabolite transporter (DMT)-like permease
MLGGRAKGSVAGGGAVESAVKDGRRIGTRTDVIVILTAVALFLTAFLLEPSAKPSISWSWLFMIAGAGCGFVVVERAKGHGWRTSVPRSILLCLAIGITCILGNLLSAACGPIRLTLWEAGIAFALWGMMAAAIYRLEVLMLRRLRRHRDARQSS